MRQGNSFSQFHEFRTPPQLKLDWLTIINIVVSDVEFHDWSLVFFKGSLQYQGVFLLDLIATNVDSSE